MGSLSLSVPMRRCIQCILLSQVIFGGSQTCPNHRSCRCLMTERSLFAWRRECSDNNFLQRSRAWKSSPWSVTMTRSHTAGSRDRLSEIRGPWDAAATPLSARLPSCSRMLPKPVLFGLLYRPVRRPSYNIKITLVLNFGGSNCNQTEFMCCVNIIFIHNATSCYEWTYCFWFVSEWIQPRPTWSFTLCLSLDTGEWFTWIPHTSNRATASTAVN